jgi:hypothetical protein
MRLSPSKYLIAVLLILLCLPLLSAQENRAQRRTSEQTRAAPSNREKSTSKSPQYLPFEDGQKWVAYDIRAYTSLFPDKETPQQEIVDWVLRETGTEIWFNEPLGFMNATRDELRVYHVPDVQRKVRSIVERFLKAPTDKIQLGVHIITINSPNWRARAMPLMRPIAVQTPGVDAWLLSKENAALLVAQLRKRSDYAEHGPQDVVLSSGESEQLETRKTRTYSRTISWLPNSWPAYQVEPGSLQEGYLLELSPLLSVDGANIDAAIQCQVDQVERFIPVQVDVPVSQGQTKRVQIEVPQVVSWRLHERFRWPTDQVLVLSCGVVAAPQNERAAGSLPLPMNTNAPRADALLILDCRSTKAEPPAPAPREANGRSPDFTRGRY